MKRPLPHQLIQAPWVQSVPPPLMPPAPWPVVERQEPPTPPPAATPTPVSARRRRRFRAPRALREDAFWTGALTAMCIGGLLMAIIATT
ncbi:hypothetical protein [Streptomyces sp. NBC_00986]|uniref:hypothetical protein n=1 Tax=Streptomyces sp. NBC_00986 TaxID=2903702 RepID=UPI00386C57C0|nr:hypothetical protein OG504_28980 [Streptomyces sp. NBC_00986]